MSRSPSQVRANELVTRGPGYEVYCSSVAMAADVMRILAERGVATASEVSGSGVIVRLAPHGPDGHRGRCPNRVLDGKQCDRSAGHNGACTAWADHTHRCTNCGMSGKGNRCVRNARHQGPCVVWSGNVPVYRT